MFDTDKSGKIDKDEIVSLLSGEDLANVVSKDSIGKAMKEID